MERLSRNRRALPYEIIEKETFYVEGKRIKRNRRGVPTKTRRTNTSKFKTDLDTIFRNFIRDRKAEGVGESAVNDYEYSFRYLKEYLDRAGVEHDIRNIDEGLIRDYIVYMRDEAARFENHPYKTDKDRVIGLSPSTINTRIKSLKTLYNRLERDGDWTDNVLANIKQLPNPIEAVDVLTPEELRELLRVPDQRSYAGFRDFVLMNFLLDSFVRIGEAVQLRKGDFDFAGKCVTIPANVAKNRKFRIVPLGEKTVRLITELIEENETDFDSEYVFLTNYGAPVTTERFRTRLNDFVEQTSITKNVHPHLFRHTAATTFLQNGGDLRHLQKLLGHSDLRMVERYTHLSNPSLTNQHREYSVMNNIEEKLEKPRRIKR